MRTFAMALAASMMTLVDTAAAAMPIALDAGNPAELGVRRGTGCRNHPESKWCAQHYGQAAQRRARPPRYASHRPSPGYSTRGETAAANRQFAPPPASYAPPPAAAYGPPPPPAGYAAAAAPLPAAGFGGGRLLTALLALGLVTLGVVAITRNDRHGRPTSP